MCSKRPFASKGAAKQSVRAMHETVRVYWCVTCKGYHTTQERYGKVASNSRAWNTKHTKARNRQKKGSE